VTNRLWLLSLRIYGFTPWYCWRIMDFHQRTCLQSSSDAQAPRVLTKKRLAPSTHRSRPCQAPQN
jgi:hypothetical protein